MKIVENSDVFAPWLSRWRLLPDGAAFTTIDGQLLRVLHDGRPAMLKIAHSEDGRRGAALRQWYGGRDVARVLAREGDALLLEHAMGDRNLKDMVQRGEDDAATKIICEVVSQLHTTRNVLVPALIPLTDWFHQLRITADAAGGMLPRALSVANELLHAPQNSVVLHGDIHHGNILDGGKQRGWLAIDPKALSGERGYDYANIFCNPTFDAALGYGRLRRQAEIVATMAKLDLSRLLSWILVYAGLSASWLLSEEKKSDFACAIAKIAADELDALK